MNNKQELGCHNKHVWSLLWSENLLQRMNYKINNVQELQCHDQQGTTK